MIKSSYYIDITSKYFNKRISIAPFYIISKCMIPQNSLKGLDYVQWLDYVALY